MSANDPKRTFAQPCGFSVGKDALLPVDLPPTLSLPSMHTMRIFRLCDSYIATLRFLSIPYGLHATSSASNKGKGELVMANMGEVSKDSRRSILAFGIAAVSIVLLIIIGVVGENGGSNTPQTNVESSHPR